MKKLLLLPLTAILFSCQVAFAQDDDPKFKINPIGRLLLDGAGYISHQKEDFKGGFAIPDVRLGARMKYGKWSATLEVGFAYNKVGLKDLYFQYDFNEQHQIKAGSFIHQYGLQSATGSSSKVTMEEPVSNAVFNDPRQLGVQYVFAGKRIFASASAHVEPKSATVILRPNQFTQEGYGFRARIAYHPISEDGKIMQIGISGGFATPQNVNDPDQPHDSFQFKANFPTSVAQVTALDAVVDKSMNLWKFTPEILAAFGPVALESQYYFQQVNRRENLRHYIGQGAYAIVRGLILGGNYKYNPGLGALQQPGKGTLEAVLAYNYSSLSDSYAGIYGGRLNDFSVTFNYYINKYMLARLHYSYTHTWDRIGAPDMSVNGIMARLQVMF